MKKYVYLLTAMISLLAVGFISCSSDDSDNQPVEYFRGARVSIVGKQMMPAWLVQKVEKLEGDNTYYTVKKGTYQGEIFYWLDIMASSCPFCELYDANGVWFNESHNYSESDISDLSHTDLWEIVYSYPSIEELRTRWEFKSDNWQ